MELSNKTKIGYLLILSFFLAYCSDCDHSKIKNISVKTEINRFDSMLYALNNPRTLVSDLMRLRAKDTFFYHLYFNKLYNLDYAQSGNERIIFEHINNTQVQTIRKKVDTIFGDFSSVKKELNLLARYHKLYYPKTSFPTIHFCYSGLAGFMAWHYDDDNLMVDLDMYLGANFEGYPPYFPQFKYTYFEKDYLVQNIGKELIRKAFLPYEQVKPKNMLSFAILEAAKIIELEKLMPCRPIHKLFEYTQEQWEWAEREESMIWTYLVKENLLFESEYQKYRPMVGEAPATLRSGVADGAPPRIAIYSAYKMLKKFLSSNEVKDMYELIEKYSDEQLLNLSKYKP